MYAIHMRQVLRLLRQHRHLSLAVEQMGGAIKPLQNPALGPVRTNLVQRVFHLLKDHDSKAAGLEKRPKRGLGEERSVRGDEDPLHRIPHPAEARVVCKPRDIGDEAVEVVRCQEHQAATPQETDPGSHILAWMCHMLDGIPERDDVERTITARRAGLGRELFEIAVEHGNAALFPRKLRGEPADLDALGLPPPCFGNLQKGAECRADVQNAPLGHLPLDSLEPASVDVSTWIASVVVELCFKRLVMPKPIVVLREHPVVVAAAAETIVVLEAAFSAGGNQTSRYLVL